MMCLRDWRKNGIVFVRGENYKVEYNPVDRRFYAFTPMGFTDITDYELKTVFV